MMPTDIVQTSAVDIPSNVLILLARHLGFTTACHMQGHFIGCSDQGLSEEHRLYKLTD